MIRASVNEVSTLAITLYGLAYAYFTPDLASTLDVNPQGVPEAVIKSPTFPTYSNGFFLKTYRHLLGYHTLLIRCSRPQFIHCLVSGTRHIPLFCYCTTQLCPSSLIKCLSNPRKFIALSREMIVAKLLVTHPSRCQPRISGRS